MQNYIVTLLTATLTAIAAIKAIRLTDLQLPEELQYCRYRWWPAIPVAFAVVGAMLAWLSVAKVVSLLALGRLVMTYLMVVMAAIYDYKLKLIPNAIPAALIVVCVVLLLGEGLADGPVVPFLLSSLVGCLSSGLLLYIAAKLTKGGIGYGDIKLMGAIGFGVGFYAVFSVLLAALLVCLVVSLPMLLLKKKELSGDLPFAPFICAGYMITLSLSLY